ncbi:MAG: hypothetical protein AB7Q81_11880 [Gammaproteobacteria bacterium]
MARYFHAFGLFGELDFQSMKEAQPDALFDAWLGLGDVERHAMDAEFKEIFGLGSEKGFRAITDEAEWHLVEPEARSQFVEKLAALSNHYERAMITFLEHQAYWKGARLFCHADTLPYWRKRKRTCHTSMPRLTRGV